MSDDFSNLHWHNLLRAIKRRKCTPFIGAGACLPTLDTGGAIASAWADDYGYPLSDRRDLQKVAQFIALESKAFTAPLDLMVDYLQQKDFQPPPETLTTLAMLPLPLYITTNYDDFMFRALQDAGKRPRRKLCSWYKHVPERCAESPAAELDDQEADSPPSVDEPIVFHLHGHHETLASMVLTEDDYLDFFIALMDDPELLPELVRLAIIDSSLLFVGYSISDINFRVIFRLLTRYYIANSLQPSHVSVQFDENTTDEDKARTYLTQYFGKMKINMYWGDAETFAAELGSKWAAVTASV